jgi:putative drug exporter of the RND superfamily
MSDADNIDHDMEAAASNFTPRSGLYRWGIFVARRWRLVLVSGVLAVVGGVIAYPYLQSHLIGLDWEADSSESAQVSAFIQEHFDSLGAEQEAIVFTAPGPQIAAVRPAVNRVVGAARSAEGVAGVVGPFDVGAVGQVSKNRRVAVAVLGLAGNPSLRATRAAHLQQVVAEAARGSAMKARLTGLSPILNDEVVIEERGAATGETIGVVLALIVLVLALGSLVAACVPLIVTGVSLSIIFGALALASLALPFTSFIISCVTMIGTGLAIDYSLFVVSRFREQLVIEQRSGVTRKQATIAAIGSAIATSGRTIVVAGVIVALSMCSLFALRASIFREIALAIGVAVVCTLLCTLTVLPAVLAALGPQINRLGLPRTWIPAELQPDRDADTPTGWERWANWVIRRPVAVGSIAAMSLLVAAWPVSGLRYGLDYGMSALSGTPSGQGAATLSEAFTPGALAPVQIIATRSGGQPLDEVATQKVEASAAALAGNPHVAHVDLQRHDGYLLVTAIPATPVDSPATTSLVEKIRSDASILARSGGPQLRVGGATASFIDLDHVVSTGMLPVLGLVVGVSLLYLLFVFRSVALAVKAVIMNLLTTAGAVGLTVAIFQWGWLSTLLAFTSVGFLQFYMPAVIFAVIYGLSMDYQVFLLRRVREEWLASGDNSRAVVAGIAHTARPITAAAAIMVCVFGSFIASDVLEMKQLGFGLAAAVALDAFLVRLALVPALMRVLGRWNWWFPAGLDKLTPERFHGLKTTNRAYGTSRQFSTLLREEKRAFDDYRSK